MKNALQFALEKHLGRRGLGPDPTLYEVLGVDEKATQDEIASALRLAAASWNKSDTKSDAQSAQLVAKKLKLAQATLLDSQKRAAYDASMPRSEKTSVCTEEFFPDTDPLADFDPSACLVGAGVSSNAVEFGSVQERWEVLRRSIPSLSQVALMEADRVGPPEIPKPVFTSTSSLPREPNSAIDRIEQLKRQRRQRNTMSVVGVVGLALLFLSYAGVRFVWNRMAIKEQELAQASLGRDKEPSASTGTSEILAKRLEPRADRKKDTLKKPITPQSSGLPSLIKDSSAENPELPMQSNPFNATPAKLPEMLEMPPKPAEVAMTPTPEPKPAETPPSEMKPADAKPADSEPMAPSPSSVTPTIAMPEMAMANANEMKEWSETMKKARSTIEKADFESFHKLMETAFELSKSEESKAKQARLDQLGQLYEIFIVAMREAKSKTRGTEVITVGKNKVNIVEVKDNELVVRIQGKTERYAWDRLPPGIAMAMADLSLSEQDPTDIAARAVYFSLSPARNDLTAKKVKDWFEKSVGKGKIREDLPQALTDKYE